MPEQISIPARFDKFVSSMISSGRYKNASDLVESAISILQTWEQAVDEIATLAQDERHNLGLPKKFFYKDLLNTVEEALGRNSSRVTGSKSW